jgi:predicted DNA-binding transcriptional regulator
MASKDQGIGAVILIVSIAVILFYIWWLFLSPNYGYYDGWSFRELGIVIPVFLIVVGVFAIAAWIGYTMASTPPPKPLEEIPEFSETEEKKAQAEKKEPEKKAPS